MATTKANATTIGAGHHYEDASYAERRNMSAADIQDAVRQGSVPQIAGRDEAFQIAKAGGWEADALCAQLDAELAANPPKSSPFRISFKNPKHFTWLLVAFASMGGMLSGLDQSLISGANLFLPDSRRNGGLGLNTSQESLIDATMPLGAVGGALILSPCNEYFGRRWSIIIACILYTVGAALEAGSISFGMLVASRIILGMGVGLEGGTVPVYVAETVERRLRGNLVSLYQFNIALGEVLGYAVAAMFLNVPGNWRYILGSSLVFSTIMLVGMLFMPESPRFLMHQGRPLEAYEVWKRIRGTADLESREEFLVMKVTTEQEEAEISQGAGKRKAPWLDFITKPRARRAIVYANIMIFLGQFTGINAVMYYMSVLLNDIGFNETNANYMSLVGGGALLFGTIPACLYMERAGRRFWAIAMLPLFTLGLVLVSISYHIPSIGGKEGVYLTGLIIYEFFFGSYACLTWVIPAEVYPTYLRSYGMTSSDGWLFLSSFIVTFTFTKLTDAFTPTGVAIGWFGGWAVIGWFYQIFFMPETKDKTLEEIDLIFERPTMDIVRENARNSWRTTKDICCFRWAKVFHEGFEPRRESIVDVSSEK